MAHKEAIEELEDQIIWLRYRLTMFAPPVDRRIIFDEILKKQEKLVELKENKGKEL